MAINPLGSVKLPAYVTDIRRRTANLPPPPTPPPTTPPPGMAAPSEVPGQFVSALPTARTTRQFLRATPEEQGPMLPPKVQAVGKGITRGIGEVGTGLTSPKGLGTMAAITAATAFAPPVVLGLLGMGFTVEGIHQLANKVPAATQAFRAGNVEEGTRLLTTAVPDLAMAIPGAMAAPGMAGKAAGAIGRTLPEGGVLEALAPEEGFTTIEFLSGGRLLGRDHVLGSERVGGTMPATMHGSMQLAERPDAVTADIRTPPKTTTELPTVLDLMVARGVNPAGAFFKTPEGKVLSFDELPQVYPEVAEWAKKAGMEPPPTPTVPPPPVPSYRTPGGRVGTVTDPMKLQRRGEIELRQAQQLAATLPEPKPGGKVGKVKQPRFPMEPVPQPTPEPTPAAEAAPPPGSALERAIVAMMEHNRLLSEQLRILTERVTGTPQPEPAAPAAPSKSVPQVPTTKAAAPPEIPTTPGIATPAENLAAQIQQSIQEAPKVELTPAEAKGMGATPAKGKKGPVSYVGKTMEEKYAPKEPAAQPEAIKAAATPTTQAELRDAIDAFNRGEGRPVNIVRRGLGGAKPTRGVILDNIKDMKGRPTEYYSYMPDNWSGDPFAIRIREMEPNPEGAAYTMPVPRHAQRTYDLGSQIAVGRKARKSEEFMLPGGGTGYKLKDVTLPPEQVGAMIDRFEASGTPEALEKSAELKKHLEPDGSIVMQQVLHGKGAPTIQARHTVRTITKPEAPSGRLGSVLDTPARRVAQDVEQSQEYLAREKELGADPESIAIEKRKLGIRDVPGRAKLYFKGELEPVAKTVEPTTTQPSREIKPQTAAAEKEVRERMTAAGPAHAQKPIPPPPGPQEPGQPVQREVTKGEIQKEARVSKPTETYKGQRKREMALEEMERKRMEYQPTTLEAPKTPPPPKPVSFGEGVKKKLEAAHAKIEELSNIHDSMEASGASKEDLQKIRNQIDDIEERDIPHLEDMMIDTGMVKTTTAPAPTLESVIEQQERLKVKEPTFTPTPGGPKLMTGERVKGAPGSTLNRVFNTIMDQLQPLEKQEFKQGFPLRQATELRNKLRKLGVDTPEPTFPPPAKGTKAKAVEPKTSAKLTEPPETKSYTAPKIPPPPTKQGEFATLQEGDRKFFDQRMRRYSKTPAAVSMRRLAEQKIIRKPTPKKEE